MTDETAPRSVTYDCKDEEAWLVHSPAGLSISTHPITVCRGRKITIHLAPPVDEGDAYTRPKNPSDKWLVGENKPKKDRIVLKAPANAGEVQYSITIDGVGTLDPGIRVV